MQTKKILTKLRLINWHYFSNETISLKNINLFSGENGAGKSTILDAIQLILTTNSRKFNIAANNESKRTLKSYVRGKTGEEGNEYLRKGAVISYIALEIYEENKQRSFVLGAKFDSPDLESEVKRKWFCEEGTLEQLSFITDNKPSIDDKFRNHGKKISFILQTTSAKDRFKHRLGHLQDNFFELLSKSLAFKPMKDVKSFVSQFILPEKTIDIAALRDNIRNLKEMQLLVEKVKGQVKALEKIQDTYNEVLRIDEQILVVDILLKIAEADSVEENIAKKSKDINLELQNKIQSENQSHVLKQDIESLEDQHIKLQTALNSGETVLLINSIKNQIISKKRDHEKYSSEVEKMKDHLKRVRSALQWLSEYCLNLGEELSAIENTDTDTQERNNIIINIESVFTETAKKIQNEFSESIAAQNNLSRDLAQLSQEIKDLERNKITYDKNVITLKEAIEREFEARGISSEVRILADLLEISDSKWQNAVEGYLNSQRFHIIVEPQYYDIAAEVYDRNKSRIHTAAIVNTAKLKVDIVPDNCSLASAVLSENIYARAYVNYLLGRVTMCESVSQMKEHSIAITQSCMLYQGNALRKINPEIYRMPYIGKYALEQQLKIKKVQYEEKSNQKSKIDKLVEKYDKSLNAINACNFEMLREVINAPVSLKQVSDDISKLELKLKEAENDPTYLQLQMESEHIKQQLEKKKAELGELNKKITYSEFQVNQLSNDIDGLKTNLDSLKNQINMLSHEKESALDEAKKKFDDHKRSKSADTINDNYQRRKKGLDNNKILKTNELVEFQLAYKDGELGKGIEMMQDYSDEYNTLVRHDLISYEEKLRGIKENCEIEFRESFLAKIRENIEKAISLFKELNKTLKPIYYGNDSYRFDWMPDKKKKKMYEMIMSEFNLGGFNLFSTQFDEEYHDEMNELFSKLTASDEHGDDVIREYTDYRSYLDYDIDIVSKDGKTQKFSKIYREKSGGETQTPYYVAIAASFVQLYSIGETIRIIMLDEAFDKMDEERIQSMLEFFKTQNFQVILAAPTSRLEVIGEQADNIIMIYTDSSHNSFAEEFSYDEI